MLHKNRKNKSKINIWTVAVAQLATIHEARLHVMNLRAAKEAARPTPIIKAAKPTASEEEEAMEIDEQGGTAINIRPIEAPERFRDNKAETTRATNWALMAEERRLTDMPYGTTLKDLSRKGRRDVRKLNKRLEKTNN